jgi:hypothetical protein
VSKKSKTRSISEQKKNPRMEACGLAIRRPPCGDFFFARKLSEFLIFLTPPYFRSHNQFRRGKGPPGRECSLLDLNVTHILNRVDMYFAMEGSLDR